MSESSDKLSEQEHELRRRIVSEISAENLNLKDSKFELDQDRSNSNDNDTMDSDHVSLFIKFTNLLRILLEENSIF